MIFRPIYSKIQEMQAKNLSLPSRARSCAHKGEPLCAGEEYVSYLDTENKEMVREDFCISCWKEVEEQKKGVFWRGRIAEKKQTKCTPDEKALAYCQSLIKDEPTTDHEKILFVLALYLERRGGLTRCRHAKGVADLLIYEIPDTGETYSVKSTFLTPQEGEKIIARLNETIS